MYQFFVPIDISLVPKVFYLKKFFLQKARTIFEIKCHFEISDFCKQLTVKIIQFQLMWLDKFLRLIKMQFNQFFLTKKVAIVNRLGDWHLNWCSDRNRLLSIFLFLFPLLHYFFRSLNRAVGIGGNSRPPAPPPVWARIKAKFSPSNGHWLLKKIFMRRKKEPLFKTSFISCKSSFTSAPPDFLTFLWPCLNALARSGFLAFCIF